MDDLYEGAAAAAAADSQADASPCSMEWEPSTTVSLGSFAASPKSSDVTPSMPIRAAPHQPPSRSFEAAASPPVSQLRRSKRMASAVASLAISLEVTQLSSESEFTPPNPKQSTTPPAYVDHDARMGETSIRSAGEMTAGGWCERAMTPPPPDHSARLQFIASKHAQTFTPSPSLWRTNKHYLETVLQRLVHEKVPDQYSKDKFLHVERLGALHKYDEEDKPTIYKVITAGWGVGSPKSMSGLQNARDKLREVAPVVDDLLREAAKQVEHPFPIISATYYAGDNEFTKEEVWCSPRGYAMLRF